MHEAMNDRRGVNLRTDHIFFLSARSIIGLMSSHHSVGDYSLLCIIIIIIIIIYADDNVLR